MDIQFVSASQNESADILFIGFDGENLFGNGVFISKELNDQLLKMIKFADFIGEWGELSTILGMIPLNKSLF